MDRAVTVDTSGGSEARIVTLPARPEPIRVRVDHTAVVVIDMQNAYASPGGYLDLAGFDIAGAARVIEQTAKVLETARAAGMPVIYFQNGWDEAYVEAGGPGSPNWHKSNALKTMRQRPELHGRLLARGGWDYDLVDALAPAPSDIVLPKTRYSGFFNSQLDSVLRSRGIRNIVFVGIATNVCVESTLRDGFFLEYFGIMLEDATHQAGPEFVQKAAVYNVETFFGWVSTVADFCGAFGQIPGDS
jgi:ureidoacrylate peracid hydrolase